MSGPVANESAVYDGRVLRGLIKPAAGGFEAFIVGDDDALDYLAKAQTRREAAHLIHAHTTRATGAQHEQLQQRKPI
jgi:hypothetical protein